MTESEQRLAIATDRLEAVATRLESIPTPGPAVRSMQHLIEIQNASQAKLDAYRKLAKKPTVSTFEVDAIVEAIEADLKERKGMWEIWDDEVENEIRQSLRNIVASFLCPTEAEINLDTAPCCNSSHRPRDTACKGYLEGANGRCVYCDHAQRCHPGPGATCEIGSGEGASANMNLFSVEETEICGPPEHVRGCSSIVLARSVEEVKALLKTTDQNIKITGIDVTNPKIVQRTWD